MTRQKAFRSLVALSVAVCPLAHADGFRISELSARGTGIGGAISAIPDEATVLPVNPAALSFLRGTHLSLGATVSLPEATFVGVAPDQQSSKMQSQVLFPPNVSLSHSFASGIGIGVAATAPYLSKTDWGTDWAGNRIVTSSEFRVIRIMPAVSLRLSEKIAIGVGIPISSLRWIQSRVVDGMASGQLLERWETDGTLSYGVQAGLMMRPHDWISFALTYESRTAFTLENASVSHQGLTQDAPADGMPTTYSTQIVLPEAVRAGVSLSFFGFLTLAGEIEFIRWSSFTPLTVQLAPSGTTLAAQSGWKDTFVGKAGAELKIQDVMIRGGVLLGENPIPDSHLRPSLPLTGGVGYTLGIGYTVSEGLRLDFAFERFESKERNVVASEVLFLPGRTFNGKYTLASSVIGLNVSYSWNPE